MILYVFITKVNFTMSIKSVKQIDFKSIKANTKHIKIKQGESFTVEVSGFVIANREKSADFGIKTVSQGFFKATLPDDAQGECVLESETLFLPANICASLTPLSKISFHATLDITGLTIHDITSQSIKDLI